MTQVFRPQAPLLFDRAALAMPRRVRVFERWLEWMTLQDAVWDVLWFDRERFDLEPLCLWASGHAMGRDLDSCYLYRITSHELEGDDELDDDPFCIASDVCSVLATNVG